MRLPRRALERMLLILVERVAGWKVVSMFADVPSTVNSTTTDIELVGREREKHTVYTAAQSYDPYHPTTSMPA